MKIDINNNIEEDISQFFKKLVKGGKHALTYFNIDIPAPACPATLGAGIFILFIINKITNLEFIS